MSVNYLTTGKEPETQIVTDKSSLTKRDSKQIEAILSDTEALLKQDGLMFDGDPASPEAIRIYSFRYENWNGNGKTEKQRKVHT